MPKIPQLQSQVEQQTGNVPLIRPVSQPDVSGQGVSQVVSAVSNIYAKEKNNADQVAVMEADKKLSALETQMLYNPDTGALNKKGKDAFGAVEEVDSGFSSGISDIEDSLSNEDQKVAFRKLAYSRQADISRSMNKHVSQERRSYETQETEAYIQVERDAAIQNPMDIERVNAALQRQTMATMAFAERNGLPPEVTKKALQEVQSKTHSAVIEQMLAQGNDQAATKYFEANSDSIVGEQKTRLTKDLETGSLAGESQRKADALFNNGKDFGASLEEAKKIDDPKVRDATVSRLKELNSQQELLDRDRKEKTNVRMANIVDAGGDPRGKPGWTDLSTSERSNIEAYMKHKKEGKDMNTDWSVYYDLKRMGSNPATRDQFNKLDLYGQYINKLAPTEFKELTGLQDGSRNGDEKSQKLLDGYRTDSQVVKDALLQLGIKKEDSDEAVAFRRMVDEQVIQLQQKTGKKATNEDIQNITDVMSTKVVTDKGLIWDTTKPAFLVDPNQDIVDVDIKDVPRAERVKIQEVLKRNGKPDSDTAIAELYRQKLNKSRNK